MKKVLLKTFIPVFVFLAMFFMFGVSVKAAGNSIDEATELTAGVGVTDSLVNGGDLNYYKFNVDGKGYFILSLFTDQDYHNTSGWVVQLYDSKMEKITGFYLDNDCRSNKTDILAYSEGVFYVTVEGSARSWNSNYCPSGIPYTIKYAKVDDDSWESENNDSANTANIISIGEKYKGILSTYKRKDIDYYKITKSNAGYFTVKLGLADGEELIGQSDGWTLEVFDKNLKQIACYNNIITDFETMKFMYPEGTYYIAVSASNYSKMPKSIYYILVNEIADNLVEQEENNDSNTANDIVPGVGRWGMRQNNNDDDCYKFTVNDSGVFNVSLSPRADADTTNMGNGWKLVVKDKNNEIIYNNSNIKNAFETDPIFYTPGTYYIQIRGQAAGVEYDVNVNIPAKTGYYAKYDGCLFFGSSNGTVFCYREDGTQVINEFKCDGEYTYYFQADGTAMKDRLTYHPDGVHVIYFDADGHEVFSDFAHISKSIAGTDVDDMCFFNVYGYMYVDTLTYDKTGTKLYYVNPYGVLERNGWFQFSGHEFDAGLGFSGVAGGYGYANWDCSLMVNANIYDWNGNLVYMQGDGHMLQ